MASATPSSPCSDSVTELLLTWNIPEAVVRRFKDNEIEIEQFKDLNEELLKELCPAIGTRLNLRNKIQEFITSQTDTIKNCSIADEKDIPDTCIDLDDINSIDIYIPKPQFPDFELKTLLTTSPCGKSVLQYYDVHKCQVNRKQYVDLRN